MTFVITALFLASRVLSAPLPEIGNVTVSGPGVSDHGKPNLVCFPTSLMDITIFVFVNYLTHAASARLPNGASTRRTIKVVIDSLCYPILGIGYALPAIAQWDVGLQKRPPWIVLPKDDLTTAHKAGALITACRNDDWLPNEKDESYEHVTVEKDSSDSKSSSGSHAGDAPSSNQQEPPTTLANYRCKLSDVSEGEKKRWLRPKPPDEHFNIFGGGELPKGYGWVFVPWDAKIERPTTHVPTPEKSKPSLKRQWSIYGDQNLELPEMPLGAEYSLFQPIAAVVQAISAGITLYRTRGDQLDRYGFTAFGLTVVPYLVMSIVNFFAHFAVPKYSALYIVQSDILDEATLRQGDKLPRRCVVGRLPSEKLSQARPQVRIQKGTHKDGLVDVEIVESDKAESTERGDGSRFLPKMVIPPTDTSKGNAKEEARGSSNDKPNAGVAPEIKQVPTATPDAGPEPSPGTRWIILSRFPSAQLDDDSPCDDKGTDDEAGNHKPEVKKRRKRPIGRKTMKAMQWAIGLSSLVIIAAFTRMQLGTATKPRWKDMFIVWLVFSCLSDVATQMALGVSSLLLTGCLWVVRRVYNLVHQILTGVLRKCLEWLKQEAKGKRDKLKDIHQQSHDTWWSYADDVIMFILKFGFFFILLFMVSQQLLDYGDCTYFRS